MYADEYRREPNWGLNPEFVKRVQAKRRAEAAPRRAAARLNSAIKKLGVAQESAEMLSPAKQAEREKLEKMRKAADRAIRAANEALRALDGQEIRHQRPLVRNPRSMSSIVALVSRATGVPVDVIHSKSRKHRDVFVRQAVMYWCVRRTNRSCSQIGRFLDRDHTTVLHGVDNYVEQRAFKGRNLRKVR